MGNTNCYDSYCANEQMKSSDQPSTATQAASQSQAEPTATAPVLEDGVPKALTDKYEISSDLIGRGASGIPVTNYQINFIWHRTRSSRNAQK